MKRLMIILMMVFIGSPAVAQELDTASQFWYKVRDFLGETDFSQYDTTNEVKSAINAGLRQVALDIPVIDTAVVSIAANTFYYALPSSFIQNGLPGAPFSIWRVSNDGSQISGVSIVDPKYFGITAGGTSPDVYGPFIAGAAIKKQYIWIYPAGPVTDKLHIYGPVDATPHSHGASLETTIPETDRIAAVYWAVAILAESRREYALADRYMARYDRHVANRKQEIQNAVTTTE